MALRLLLLIFGLAGGLIGIMSFSHLARAAWGAGPNPRVVYLTDIEGRGDFLRAWVEKTADVRFDSNGELEFATPEARFVFGGDALDRGPDALWILARLVAFKDRYPDRVTLIAGNRDINKLRFALQGDDVADMQRIFKRMNAANAFELRRQELARSSADSAPPNWPSDDDVFASFKEEVRPTGILFAYLERADLAYYEPRSATLIVHGVTSDTSVGVVPGDQRRFELVSDWVTHLNRWYHQQIQSFRQKAFPRRRANLLGYHSNPEGVVYGRFVRWDGDPALPGRFTRDWLKRNGVKRVIVGHSPQGEVASWLRDLDNGIDFGILDTSYSNSLVTAEFQGEVSRVISYLADGRVIDQSVRSGEGTTNLTGLRVRGGNLIVVGRELLADETLGRWIGKSRLPGTFTIQILPVGAITEADLEMPWSCAGLLSPHTTEGN